MNDKLKIAVARAIEFMNQHDLSDWSVIINGERKNVAITDHLNKTIEISKYFIKKSTKREFDGIILHEIAHALLGHGFGHGDEFIEKCKSISPNEDFAVHEYNFEIGKYRLTCPGCGLSGMLNSNKPKYCVGCYNNGENHKFEIEKNNIEYKEW